MVLEGTRQGPIDPVKRERERERERERDRETETDRQTGRGECGEKKRGTRSIGSHFN